MLNKQKVLNFWESRTAIEDSRIATHYKHDSTLDYDSDFIQTYCAPNKRVLDLGCGTGDLTKKILPFVGQMVAVEQQQSFIDRLEDSPNLSKIACDLMDYSTDQLFDLIYVFGVVNFLTEADEVLLYQRMASFLKPDGILITKHACGVKEEVIVDKFSEDLGEWYHARYPFVENQRKLLGQHFAVDVVDIYPSECNRWDNTHYYAFVGKK